METVTNETRNQAVKIFLRTINCPKEAETFTLKVALYDYIDRSFSKLGCCVLWNLSLDKSESKLSKLLSKHGITPDCSKFSIVIRGGSILFSENGAQMVTIFKDTNYIPPKLSREAWLPHFS